MSTTNWNTIDRTFDKSMEWIDAVARELGSDRQRGWHALRAVLHVLRDRMLVEETAHLSAQLPMLIRGLFYDGWAPRKTPTGIRTREELFAHVTAELRTAPDIDPEKACRAVFGLLDRFVTQGEIRQVVDQLPDEIKQLWPSFTPA